MHRPESWLSSIVDSVFSGLLLQIHENEQIKHCSRTKSRPLSISGHHHFQRPSLYFYHPIPEFIHVYAKQRRSFLSTFFIWNFITTLFAIWAFFLKRINNEEGQITTNMVTCPNITLIVLFCLINLSYRVGLAVYQTSNRPFSDPNLTNSTYISTACAISSIVFLAALFYVFYLYCQIWNRRDELLWRSTLFVHISFFFFMLIFVLFLAGGFNVF